MKEYQDILCKMADLEATFFYMADLPPADFDLDPQNVKAIHKHLYEAIKIWHEITGEVLP